MRTFVLVMTFAAVSLLNQASAQDSSLHMAVVENNRTEVQRLVQAGTEINARMSGGWTPLMIGAKYGRVAIMRDLIRANARLDLVDDKGNTALILAVIARQTQAVRILAANRADLELQNKEGMNAIQIATLMDQSEIIQVLEEARTQPVR